MREVYEEERSRKSQRRGIRPLVGPTKKEQGLGWPLRPQERAEKRRASYRSEEANYPTTYLAHRRQSSREGHNSAACRLDPNIGGVKCFQATLEIEQQ